MSTDRAIDVWTKAKPAMIGSGRHDTARLSTSIPNPLLWKSRLTCQKFSQTHWTVKVSLQPSASVHPPQRTVHTLLSTKIQHADSTVEVCLLLTPLCLPQAVRLSRVGLPQPDRAYEGVSVVRSGEMSRIERGESCRGGKGESWHSPSSDPEA